MRIFFLVLAALLFLPRSVLAHPHAWISVRTTILVNEKGEMTAIREHWLFDKMYSAFAAKDYNPHKNGRFNDADLQALAQENVSNLKEFNYFTVLEGLDGKPVSFSTVKDIQSAFEVAPPTQKVGVVTYAKPDGEKAEGASDGKQINMDFTIQLKHPVSLRDRSVTYRIYDPTYYTDMAHYQDNPVRFVRDSDGLEIDTCTAKVETPKVDSTMLFSAAALDKNATAPRDLGYHFSEKVTLSCLSTK